MRKIIASICLNSDSIKLVVGEFISDQLHILCAINTPTKGLKSGKIKDENVLVSSIEESIKSVSNKLGIEIKKIVLGIDAYGLDLVKVTEEVPIETGIVNTEDINNLYQKCLKKLNNSSYVVVGILPLDYILDDKTVKTPKGQKTSVLKIRAVAALSPSSYVKKLVTVLKKCKLDVADIQLNVIGDYYSFKNTQTDEGVGAIINIGYDTSTISIFNKGLLINSKCYNVGTFNIVNDIAYVNKLDENTAYAIYKDLALASTRLSNPKEYRVVENLKGDRVSINQFDVSELASSRIEEILKLMKNQINVLTKREISYIIITGSLTELKDFSLIMKNNLPKNTYLGNLKIIGARDNSLVSAVGIVMSFEKKLELLGKNFSIISDQDFDTINDKNNTYEKESLFDKVFGYFFDS